MPNFATRISSPPTFNLVGRKRPRFRIPLCITLGLALLFGLWERCEAFPTKPTTRDKQVANAVAAFLSYEHLNRQGLKNLDDEISARWIKTFLESLDPRKLYFLQSDVDHFSKQKHQLDDMIKKGDIRFAYEVYQRYLERLAEREADINELIEMEHDYTVDESMDTDFENRGYPKDAAAARELWRKQIKYDFLLQKAAETELEEARKKLHRRYDTFVENRKQMDGDELLEIYLNAMTSSYDPHTSYMSPTTLENFVISMRLQLEGIGAALQMLDGHTVISKVIPGGAADKDGRLKPEDHIIGVGQGTDGEIEDVVGMRLNDVVKQIRGKKGTIVRLQVTPGGKGEPKIYDITRAQIELKDSAARSEIIETGSKAETGDTYKVGVIDLPSFYMDMDAARLGNQNYRSTTRDVANLLEQFRKEEIDVVMVDLRRNGGGSLTEAINLTGLFIDEGPIVQVKDADGEVQHYEDNDAGVSWDGPLVILTSKFSASASEIFAGAIQDYRRGVVVGDYATHGKGTVQTLQNVGRKLFRIQNAPQLGALKITMQQFYRPNGDSTQNRGVLSDVELPSVTTHLDVGESDLDHPVAFDRVDAAQFKKLDRVDNSILDQLRKQSETRCEASEDFQKVEENIAKYLEHKERKSVSLKEEIFMADRQDAEEDLLKEALEEENDDQVVDRNFYFNEALAIAIDYAELLKTGRLAKTDQAEPQGDMPKLQAGAQTR